MKELPLLHFFLFLFYCSTHLIWDRAFSIDRSWRQSFASPCLKIEECSASTSCGPVLSDVYFVVFSIHTCVSQSQFIYVSSLHFLMGWLISFLTWGFWSKLLFCLPFSPFFLYRDCLLGWKPFVSLSHRSKTENILLRKTNLYAMYTFSLYICEYFYSEETVNNSILSNISLPHYNFFSSFDIFLSSGHLLI